MELWWLSLWNGKRWYSGGSFWRVWIFDPQASYRTRRKPSDIRIRSFGTRKSSVFRYSWASSAVLMQINTLVIYVVVNNGNRTEWSPTQPVIIQVINKVERPQRVWLLLQTELEDTKSFYQLIITVTISVKKRIHLGQNISGRDSV